MNHLDSRAGVVLTSSTFFYDDPINSSLKHFFNCDGVYCFKSWLMAVENLICIDWSLSNENFKHMLTLVEFVLSHVLQQDTLFDLLGSGEMKKLLAMSRLEVTRLCNSLRVAWRSRSMNCWGGTSVKQDASVSVSRSTSILGLSKQICDVFSYTFQLIVVDLCSIICMYAF